MRTTYSTSLLGLLAVAGLAGCVNLAPEYSQPATNVAATWPVQASSQPAHEQGSLAELDWRTLFQDERLQSVIELALRNNLDLRVAVLNIERARARYGVQRAALLPSLGLDAGQTAARTPAELSTTGNDVTSHQYGVDLGLASYELDFFGRVRNLSTSALEQYMATEEARRIAHVSLVAEVATTYLALAADRDRLTLAKSTLRNQVDAYELIRGRYELDLISELALRQARMTVETARSDVAALTSIVEMGKNALTLLAGAPVPEHLLPAADLEAMLLALELPPGLPSELLQRRPDILAAEHQLRSANANIGAARAAFFPSISLTARVGTASASLSGLFDRGSEAWTFAPSLHLPIFDGGYNRANLGVAKSSRDIAVAQYQRSVQEAFREVADALAQRATLLDRVNAQQALTTAAEDAYRLSSQRFDNGVDSYLAVLDSQRATYSAKQGLIATRLLHQTNVVALYKALGGGWSEEKDQASSAQVPATVSQAALSPADESQYRTTPKP